MKTKKTYLKTLFLLTFLTTVFTFGQKTVNGVVTDVDGTPLPGANIVEKSTTNGVTADFDGNFTLQISDDDAFLEVSYIGYATKELAVNGQSNIKVMLE